MAVCVCVCVCVWLASFPSAVVGVHQADKTNIPSVRTLPVRPPAPARKGKLELHLLFAGL